jgi:hypothetical protein
MKFDIWDFFRKVVEQMEVLLKPDKNNGTWHEDMVIISRLIRLRMRNALERKCGEN